jgi:DNA-binding MarR family transcriptional regulator
MYKHHIDQPFMYYFHDIAHGMLHSVNLCLKPYKLTHQQAHVIILIGQVQQDGQRICQRDIERATKVSGPSVTSLLQGLERKGFITRATRATDDRVKELFLTGKGRSLLKDFEQVFADTETRIAQGMSAQDKAKFLELLKSVSESFKK